MDLSTLNNFKGHSLPLAEQIAERINQLIIDQRLTENDKLPTEFELMEILNVGRSTVREALKILVARNVLEIKRGKGTFVTKNPGINEDPLGFAYMQDKIKLAQELIEVRTHIEPWTAYLAAQRATEADIKELCGYCDRVVDLSLLGKAHQDVDKAFHECVAHCTHNRVICNLTPIIIYSVQVFSDISESTLRRKTNISHRQICDCICSHDPEGASNAVMAHLDANRNYWEELWRGI
ncbi:FadR/GntR family transcriptional regulator [Oscillibacter sp.]|uniref:FadR/GntR family transcriptional regulator n=1 Tax=Oscillibacter sp. TaxID=1945593 RepID=UPI002605355A|nr:FadR/GntR family transcriptional regulator [Oscillibacter sp.]MDD3347200.1 FadR/GntR family transcriptional regulator [Oscillibacter sp.]